MAKYIYSSLILFFLACSSVGLIPIKLDEVEIISNELTELVDSLINIEVNCEYYNENGYFFLSFDYDSIAVFTYFNLINANKGFSEKHTVYKTKTHLVIIKNFDKIPQLFRKLRTKQSINAHILDTNKPELLSFGNSFAERYFLYKKGKFRIKYEVNFCN